MAEQQFVELSGGELVHETEKAWLIKVKDGREIWFPKSRCKWDGVTVVLPDWLAAKKKVEG